MRGKYSNTSIRPDIGQMFTAIRLPARLNRREAGALLGFSEDDISHLVAVGLLDPIGAPQPGQPLWFATVQIEELSKEPKWLAKATVAVRRHNRDRNEGTECESRRMAAAA